jgi:neutral ceramidase
MGGNIVFLRRRIIRVAAVVAVCILPVIARAQSREAGVAVRAGMARIDITPDKPVTMAGYASRTGLSTGVHDRLSARVVAFEAEGKRLVLVSTDLIGFYDGTAEYLRRAIVGKFKLEESELLLSAIHTHSAPSLTTDQEKGHKNNLEYTEGLKAKLMEAIGEAFDNMAGIRVGAGVGYCPIGANRRELRLDGSGKSSIVLGRNPYGPTDKEVLVLKVTTTDGAPVAALFDYATHATCLGGRNYTISGDVMGLAEQFAEKVLGPELIAPAFVGASGNIDPWFRVLPEFNDEPGWIAEPVLLGTVLGEEVVHVFRSIDELSTPGEIRSAFKTLSLPGKAEDGAASPKAHPLNVTVARVGEVAFVGIGAEVLTEIGMEIKSASPYRHTFVITHCNGAAGYLPPKHLYVEGGYEIRSSRFGPRAAGIVVKQVVKMLHAL